MPDKVEQILRAIHILFSKGEMYHDLPDKIILSKREMFELLEKLNYAVVEVMDRYEATTRAKEKARQEMEQEGQKIIDAAGKEAEDVYAASMLYTDSTLNDLYAMVDETKSSLREEYIRFEDSMNEQMELIQTNQRELLDQLRALAQGQKYLDLINDYNEIYMHNPEDNTVEDEFTEEEITTDSDTEYTEKDFTENTATKEKAGGKESVEMDLTEKAVIPEKLLSAKTKQKKEQVKPKIRKLIPAEFPDEMGEEWDDTPTKQKIEVKVYNGGGIPENSIFNENALKSKKDRKKTVKSTEPQTGYSPDELDAEYEQWKQENSENSEKADKTEKNGFFDRFIKKK